MKFGFSGIQTGILLSITSISTNNSTVEEAQSSKLPQAAERTPLLFRSFYYSIIQDEGRILHAGT